MIAPLWVGDSGVGGQASERWTQFADWLYANGLVENPVDGNAAYTNEFVEGAD